MSNDLFKKPDKINQLVLDILRQCTSIKMSAKYEDGATARWIEREMETMVNKIKVYLDE